MDKLKDELVFGDEKNRSRDKNTFGWQLKVKLKETINKTQTQYPWFHEI